MTILGLGPLGISLAIYFGSIAKCWYAGVNIFIAFIVVTVIHIIVYGSVYWVGVWALRSLFYG